VVPDPVDVVDDDVGDVAVITWAETSFPMPSPELPTVP